MKRNKTNRLCLLFSLLMSGSIVFMNAVNANATTPIIQMSDPTVTTDYLTSQGYTLGFSANGGGYGNYYDDGNTFTDATGTVTNNAAEPFYGRGWQSAIRDGLHSNRYNPTQAGFEDGAGAPFSLTTGISGSGASGGRLTIQPQNVALYSDPVYDFTEHEDLYADSFTNDGGNTDTDSMNESSLTQDNELRSEFDYQGYMEDASNLVDNGVGVFRHVFSYDYKRDPGPAYTTGNQPAVYSPIQQFGVDAKKLDCANNPTVPVISEGNRPTQISPNFPNQTVTNTDMGFVALEYGIRMKYTAGYHTVMYLDPNTNSWVKHSYYDKIYSNFSSTTDGWVPFDPNTATVSEVNHLLQVNFTASNAAIDKSDYSIDTTKYSQVVVTMSSSPGTTAQLLWDNGSGFASTNSVSASVTPVSGCTQTYTFDMSNNAYWTGTVTGLKLIPVSNSTITSGQVIMTSVVVQPQLTYHALLYKDPVHESYLGQASQNGINSFTTSAADDLIILSNGTDETSSKAVGLFMPETSAINKNPIAIINNTTGAVTREDRRVALDGFSNEFNNNNPSNPASLTKSVNTGTSSAATEDSAETMILLRQYLTGLFAPGNGEAGTHERVDTDLYILSGTPNQILTAANEINNTLSGDQELPVLSSPDAGLSVTQRTSTSATLSWTAATDNIGVANYEIYENHNLIGETSSGSITSYTVSGLTLGQHYTFEVRARDAAGNESEYSLPVETPTPIWNFDTNGDLEGWSGAANGNISLSVANGLLTGTYNGGLDPQIINMLDDNHQFFASDLQHAHLVFQNKSSSTRVRLYWMSDTDTSFTSTKSVYLDIPANESTLSDHTIDLSGVSSWSGTIKALRFDPANNWDGTGSIDMDSIRFTNSN